jgi:hypothetical protein
MSAEQRSFEAYARELAENARDTGAARALSVDPTGFRAAAEQAIEDLAASGVVFSAEDVRRRTGPPESDGAMGAAFLAASKRHRIVPVGLVQASRVTRHRSVLRTWIGREWA